MKIFVYGSLRTGMYNYDLYLKDRSKLIGEGYVRGIIYSIKGVSYPALVEGHGLVKGEIFEIEDEQIEDINAMEHFYGPSDSKNEYNLISTQILDSNGEELCMLPVYWYHVEQYSELLDEKILGNDYVSYIDKGKM